MILRRYCLLRILLSVINSDPNLPSSPVCEINVPEKIKSSCEDPPDLELKDLPSHLEYAFLEGDEKLPIPIDPLDQEKTTFTCPYGTFAYRDMPFSLCNDDQAQFLKGVWFAIFHDIDREKPWESSWMIILTSLGIEVDKATKFDVIAKLPHPTNLVKVHTQSEWSSLKAPTLRGRTNTLVVHDSPDFPHGAMKCGDRVEHVESDVLDFEASRARGFVPPITRASHPQLHWECQIS
ncbi:hypothetical protein Tco_0319489 [Tanacetum coccineum]